MNYLDLTLPTPAENLAADEALLDQCEAARAGAVLRFWEPREHFVVVGYSNKVRTEVNLRLAWHGTSRSCGVAAAAALLSKAPVA